MRRKNGSDYLTQAEGEVTFQLDGRELSLLAFERKMDRFLLWSWIILRQGCYAAGRYLVVDPPQEAK